MPHYTFERWKTILLLLSPVNRIQVIFTMHSGASRPNVFHYYNEVEHFLSDFEDKDRLCLWNGTMETPRVRVRSDQRLVIDILQFFSFSRRGCAEESKRNEKLDNVVLRTMKEFEAFDATLSPLWKRFEKDEKVFRILFWEMVKEISEWIFTPKLRILSSMWMERPLVSNEL